MNNVRKVREQKLISKAELARRSGLSVLTIDRVENGMACRMDTMRKILQGLGLALDDRERIFPNEEEPMASMRKKPRGRMAAHDAIS
jgi:transcriptional regulator with XRE-family HTH domain